MDTLRGTLEYSPDSLRIFTDSGELDLWKKIEPTFLSLYGLNVGFEEKFVSFSLHLNPESEWVFHYRGSRKKMTLEKSGNRKDSLDVTARLDVLFLLLSGRRVIVEADKEHFKISADTSVV